MALANCTKRESPRFIGRRQFCFLWAPILPLSLKRISRRPRFCTSRICGNFPTFPRGGLWIQAFVCRERIDTGHTKTSFAATFSRLLLQVQYRIYDGRARASTSTRGLSTSMSRNLPGSTSPPGVSARRSAVFLTYGTMTIRK